MLHVTAKWGVESVTKWLIHEGADLTIKNKVNMQLRMHMQILFYFVDYH